MAHPRGSASLRARSVAGTSNGNGNENSVHAEAFKDDTPLIDESAVLLKHEMLTERAVEIELGKSEKDGSERQCFRQDGPEGKRFIDLVLVYETPSGEDANVNDEDREKERGLAEKRKVFEANLRTAGVELEYEDAIDSKVGKQTNVNIFHIV